MVTRVIDAQRKPGRSTTSRRLHTVNQRLAAAAVAVAAAGLAACSSTSTASTGSDTSSATLSPAAMSSLVSAAENGTGTTRAICHGKKYRIGIDIYPTTIVFGANVVQGAKAIAASTGCITPIILSDNLNAETVIANVNSFIQQRVSGIAVLNAVEAPEKQAIALAKNAKIPLVTASLGEPGTPFIDVNDMQAGLDEGTAVAKAFKPSVGSARPWIIIAGFPSLLPPASDRITGWLKGVRSVFPGIPKNHIIQFNSQLNPAVTSQAIGPILAGVPPKAPVMTVGINDQVSFITAKAVHASGRPVAGSGFGGDSSGRKSVCTGYYSTSGWAPEKSMAYIYPALIAMTFGHQFSDHVYQKTQVLTRANIDHYYPGTC